MSRYIDAEQKITVPYYDEEHEEWFQKCETIDDFLENADEEIPTADVVEVVRCKDCKYFTKYPRLFGDERTDGSCEWIQDRLIEQDFFCADGERRDDG